VWNKQYSYLETVKQSLNEDLDVWTKYYQDTDITHMSPYAIQMNSIHDS